MLFFFFNDTATTEIYTLSLHDALPISALEDGSLAPSVLVPVIVAAPRVPPHPVTAMSLCMQRKRGTRPIGSRSYGSPTGLDRKSTRLNSSHANISYAVFCLKKNITNTM